MNFTKSVLVLALVAGFVSCNIEPKEAKEENLTTESALDRKSDRDGWTSRDGTSQRITSQSSSKVNPDRLIDHDVRFDNFGHLVDDEGLPKWYLDTLLRFHEEEIQGEGYNYRLMCYFKEDHEIEKTIILAKVERHTAEQVRELLNKYKGQFEENELKFRTLEELLSEGRTWKDWEATEYDWKDEMDEIVSFYWIYNREFNDLGRISPPEDWHYLEAMYNHELAVIDFARGEFEDRPAAIDTMYAYLSTWADLRGKPKGHYLIFGEDDHDAGTAGKVSDEFKENLKKQLKDNIRCEGYYLSKLCFYEDEHQIQDLIWLSKVHNRAAHMMTVLAEKYGIEIGDQWDLHKEGRAWDKDKALDWATDIAEVAKCASDSKKALDKLKEEGDEQDQQFFVMYQDYIDVVNDFSTLELKADESSSQAMIDFCTKYRPYH
ncbi:MAG: hypothetical protein HRT71_04585 [Flavobacteriales bacterium]|nr:hypothetical protein [Flavobacteriales bacterium]